MECKECLKYHEYGLCPYDFKPRKNGALKATPSKTRAKAIKDGYPDCFWSKSDEKEYGTIKELRNGLANKRC